MINIDYNFALKEIIGDKGISINEIKKLEEKSLKVHKRLIEEINDQKIGFYQLLTQNLSELKKKVDIFKNKFKNMVVLGIGGSSLGAKAIFSALEKKSPRNLYVLDNIDPDFFINFIEKLNLEETCFTIISKSGSTTETISQFLIVLNKVKNKFKQDVRERLIIITDPLKGGLREYVNNYNLISFDIPQNVGGRFSVLSPVGLVPLYFVDINIDKLLEGAKDYSEICLKKSVFENPSYLTALIQFISFLKGKNISVLFAYSKFLENFVEWYKQLWAESLGKEDKYGFTPLKAIGVTDQHSLLQLFMEGPDDKIITFIKVKNFKESGLIPEIDELNCYSYLFNHNLTEIFNYEFESVKVALAKKGKINYTIYIDKLDEYHLGALIFYFMVKTVFTGYLFGIDPFNQPGVEEGKNFTYGLMGRKGYENKKNEFESFIQKISQEFII